MDFTIKYTNGKSREFFQIGFGARFRGGRLDAKTGEATVVADDSS
jgi:hypothetical protein